MHSTQSAHFKLLISNIPFHLVYCTIIIITVFDHYNNTGHKGQITDRLTERSAPTSGHSSSFLPICIWCLIREENTHPYTLTDWHSSSDKATRWTTGESGFSYRKGQQTLLNVTVAYLNGSEGKLRSRCRWPTHFHLVPRLRMCQDTQYTSTSP